MKEIIIDILPWWWLAITISNLVYAGAYAQGYKVTHEGMYWFAVSAIEGAASIGLALIFLLNL